MTSAARRGIAVGREACAGVTRWYSSHMFRDRWSLQPLKDREWLVFIWTRPGTGCNCSVHTWAVFPGGPVLVQERGAVFPTPSGSSQTRMSVILRFSGLMWVRFFLYGGIFKPFLKTRTGCTSNAWQTPQDNKHSLIEQVWSSPMNVLIFDRKSRESTNMADEDEAVEIVCGL